MLRFFIGVILILISLIMIFAAKRKIFLIPALIGTIMIITSCCAIVPTGYTGIRTTFGKVEDTSVEAGFNLLAPWQEMILMDNREQKITFTQSSFSSDIQEVDVAGSVIFSIGKSTAVDLYRNVGSEYVSVVVAPQISEDVKSVISRYTAEGLIGARGTLSSQILTDLREDLAAYGLNIVSVAIENIDFTDAFESAVEAKQVATQTKQKAQTEQEQKTMEAQQAAERQRITAQAEADVAKIRADAEAYALAARAEAEAKANELVAASLTENLITYTKASRWNGQLPATYVGGEGALPVIDIPVEK